MITDPATLRRLGVKLEYTNGILVEKNTEIEHLKSKLQRITAVQTQEKSSHV